MSTQQNQAQPPAAIAPAAQAATPAAPAAPNLRVLVVVGVIVLVALGIGARMWYRSHYFVETENAYVAGHVHPVSSRISGVVTRVQVDDNQAVQEGDVIAVAYTGKTASIKLSGFINGSVDLEVANLITLANSTANFGLSGGTLLIDSISESSGQGEFRKVDVDVTQYESTMTLLA